MTSKITTIMKGMLVHMVENSGTTYEERENRTMVALRQRGLVTYCSRIGSYGKSHWRLTDEGTDVAKHLRAKRHGRPHAVFLTPNEYASARHRGLDMLDYVLQRPMPEIDRIVQAEVDRNDGVKPRRKHISEKACPDDNCMPGHGGKCTACAGEK